MKWNNSSTARINYSMLFSGGLAMVSSEARTEHYCAPVAMLLPQTTRNNSGQGDTDDARLLGFKFWLGH